MRRSSTVTNIIKDGLNNIIYVGTLNERTTFCPQIVLCWKKSLKKFVEDISRGERGPCPIAILPNINNLQQKIRVIRCISIR